MRSLIMKDLYNISHNAKSMFCMLMVFAVIAIPFSGAQNYIFICAILCSMMIVTTFSFDDHSSWTRYAMIMPLSKKNLVAGKFFVLLCFSLVGVVFGLIVGMIGGLIAKKIVFTMESMVTLLLVALLALVVAEIFGSLSIPLAFKFGAEKGRMLLLISFLMPATICLLAYKAFSMLGIIMTDQLLMILLYCSPLIALIWNYLMYQISCTIFSKQEF